MNFQDYFRMYIYFSDKEIQMPVQIINRNDIDFSLGLHFNTLSSLHIST